MCTRVHVRTCVCVHPCARVSQEQPCSRGRSLHLTLHPWDRLHETLVEPRRGDACPPRECPPFACPCWGQQDGPSAPYHFPWQLPLGGSGFGGEPQLSPSVIPREEGQPGRVSIALATPHHAGASHGCPMRSQELQTGSRQRKKTSSTPVWGARPSTPGWGPPPRLGTQPPAQVQPCCASRRQDAGGWGGTRGARGPWPRRHGCCLECRSLGTG